MTTPTITRISYPFDFNAEYDTHVQDSNDNEHNNHVVYDHDSDDHEYRYYEDGDYVDGNDDYSEHRGDYKVSMLDFNFNDIISECNNYVALRNTLEDYNDTSTFTKKEVFDFLNSYTRTDEFERIIEEFMDDLAMNSNRHDLYIILCEYCSERLRYDINFVRILELRTVCENVRLALQEKIALEREKIKNELNTVSHINGIKNLISQYAM